MIAGETKKVDVRFPDDYWSEDFAGKAAYFEITVKEVYSAALPEYNDAFVSEKLSYDNVGAFEEALAENLKKQFEEEAETKQLGLGAGKLHDQLLPGGSGRGVCRGVCQLLHLPRTVQRIGTGRLFAGELRHHGRGVPKDRAEMGAE